MSADAGAAQLMISLNEDQPGTECSGPVPPELRVLVTLDCRVAGGNLTPRPSQIRT